LPSFRTRQGSFLQGYGTLQYYTNGKPDEKYVGMMKDGRRDGYGEYFYTGGLKEYDGLWSNNKRNGWGTTYRETGSIIYQGYWVDNKGKFEDLLNLVGQKLTQYAITYIFDGGTNATYEVVKVIYNRSGDLKEFRVKMKFNGDKATWMEYKGTMVLQFAPFKIDFVDYNDNFAVYAYYKATSTVVDAINELFKDADDN
jgi:hypothetical protein